MPIWLATGLGGLWISRWTRATLAPVLYRRTPPGRNQLKLVSFSVENYRSITTARKIRLSDYSLLVGPNNEGKSNILHALTLAMNALVEWRRQIRYSPAGRVIRTSLRIAPGIYRRLGYNWETDFPVGKQKAANSEGASTIILDFELDEDEIQQFKVEIRSNLTGFCRCPFRSVRRRLTWP